MEQSKEDNGEAIARNLMEMANIEVPIICVVIGEGSSGGALALGVADKIIMLENAVYSILSPEGFASILYKDASKNKQAAEDMKLTAKDLKKFGIVDTIIKEPDNGAEEDFANVIKDLKKEIIKYIKKLNNMSKEERLQNRYEKYRKIGR